MIGAALRRAETSAAERVFAALSGAASTPQETTAHRKIRTLLLKPVGDRCNLACPYCYEEHRRETVDAGRIDLAAAKRVLDNLLPHVARPFDIFLHGGEPLLAGRDYFLELIRHVEDRHRGGVRWGVQTNAVLIDAEWASFFREHAFSVGVSLDGPPEIHDAQRPDRRGGGSHASVTRGIARLQEEGVEFGVTAVITESQAALPNAADALFAHFAALGLKRFDAHPAFAPIDHSRDWNLNPQAYADFMLALFDAWTANEDPEIEIRTFEELFAVLAGVGADTCHRAGRCTSIIGADPRGAAMACTRPFEARYDFGNLADTPLPELCRSEGYRRFAVDEARGRRGSRTCRYQDFCGGGCPHERLDDGAQAVSGRHIYCTCGSGGVGGYPALVEGVLARLPVLGGETDGAMPRAAAAAAT